MDTEDGRGRAFETFAGGAVASSVRQSSSRLTRDNAFEPITVNPKKKRWSEVPSRHVSFPEALMELEELALTAGKESERENENDVRDEGSREPEEIYVTMADLRPGRPVSSLSNGPHEFSTSSYCSREYHDWHGPSCRRSSERFTTHDLRQVSVRPAVERQRFPGYCRSIERTKRPDAATGRPYREVSFDGTPHPWAAAPAQATPGLLGRDRVHVRSSSSYHRVVDHDTDGPGVGTVHVEGSTPYTECGERSKAQAQLEALNDKMERLMGTVELTNRRIDTIRHDLLDVRRGGGHKKKETTSTTYRPLGPFTKDGDFVYQKSEKRLETEARLAETGAVQKKGSEKKKLKDRLLLSCLS